MEEQLWDYIDGNASAAERTFVEGLIATQDAWGKKYHELLAVHRLMNTALELDEPSMRFSQNVMEEITRYQIAPATKTYIDKKVIYGIGIFFMISIAATLVYGFSQVNWSSGDILSTYNFSKLDFSKFFNSSFTSIFMAVNVVIGLMLLDMYLGKKKGAAV